MVRRQDTRPIQAWLEALSAEGEHEELLRQLHSFARGRGIQLSIARTSRSSEADASPAKQLSESFVPIMRELDLDLWEGVLAASSDEKLPVPSRQLSWMAGVSRLWAKLLGCPDALVAENVVELVEYVAELLEWRVVRRDHLGSNEVCSVAVQYSAMDLPRMMPVIGVRVGDSERELDSAFSSILSSRAQMSARLSVPEATIFNLVIGSPRASLRYQDKLSGTRDIIVLSSTALKQILLTTGHRREFNKCIRRSLGFRKLNPYRYVKPVERESMFYGRAGEISSILDGPDQDFAIVGSRRIGKTSLCRQVERLCREQGEASPVYVKCDTVRTYDELLYRLTQQIAPRRAQRVKLHTFGQLVQANRSAQNGRYLFLLDEVDGLLQMAVVSGDWSMFEVLRQLARGGLTQTVMTGYKRLYQEWMDLTSPLFNFVNPMYLSTLDEVSARELARRPMSELGLHYESDDIPIHIVREAGRHPCIVQYFCSELLNNLEGSSNRIDWATFAHVHELPAFDKFLLRSYEFPGSLDPLEKLILAKMAVSNIGECSSQVLIELLDLDILHCISSDVIQALAGLEIAGLLGRVSGEDRETRVGDATYQFMIPAFPAALKRSRPMEREIKELETSIKEKGDGHVG